MSTSATLMATRGYCRKSQLISNENPPCSAPTLTLLANDTWSATRQGEDKPRPYYATMKRLKRPVHRRGDPGGRPVNCPRPAALLVLAFANRVCTGATSYHGTAPFSSKNPPVGPSAGKVARRTTTCAPCCGVRQPL